MTRNTGSPDRGLRAFVIAPAAIVVAFVLGAGTVGGIVLLVVAGIMLVSAATAFCPTSSSLGSRRIRAACIASATTYAEVTPNPAARRWTGGGS